ncbi:hypothetical protein [Filifactor alocis]|uniref:hypothetical protein n=1 Tax=Filifactor alocis TaxID=143361 RepID=UPI0028EE2D70|nr:hypothetical protein [Filifactor alocis]
MKKLLSILMVTCLTLSMVACGDAEKQTEPVEETTQEATQTQEETEEPQKPTEEMKSIEDYKKIVGMCVGESDKITDLSIDAEKGLININLELGDPAPLTYEDLASSRISSITDKLVDDKAIQTIYISVKGVGDVELLNSQACTNEYGMKYFPIETIDKQLKK